MCEDAPMHRALVALSVLTVVAGCSRDEAHRDAPPSAASAALASAAAAPSGGAIAAEGTSASPAPVAAASTAPLDASAAGAKAFGAACVADAECAGGVCFHKRIKGPDAGKERRGAHSEAEEHDGYCSLRCDKDADCPVPPTRGKCGARGMCKRSE